MVAPGGLETALRVRLSPERQQQTFEIGSA
jgi:hypothetical protein